MSRGAASWVVLALVLAGCRPKAAPSRADAAPSATPTSITVGATAPEDTILVVLGRTSTMVEDETIDPVTLRDVLKRQRATSKKSKDEAIVVADKGVPYRRMTDALFALGQEGYSKLHLMVLQSNKAGVDAGPPGFVPPRAAVDLPPMKLESKVPALEPALVIAGDGATFRTRGGVVPPGCAPVPRVDGALDEDGIRRCAQKLKAQASDERAIVISATPTTPYVEIIETMDALRSDGHVEMFPDVSFGAPK